MLDISIGNKVTPAILEAEEYIIFPTLQNEIHQMDFTRIDELFEALYESGLNGKNKVSFTFSGYTSDNREVFQIPEIRNYVLRLYGKHPDMFYFSCLKDSNAKILLICLLEVVTTHEANGETRTDIKPNQLLFDEIQKHLDSCAAKYGDKLPITVNDILS